MSKYVHIKIKIPHEEGLHLPWIEYMYVEVSIKKVCHTQCSYVYIFMFISHIGLIIKAQTSIPVNHNICASY